MSEVLDIEKYLKKVRGAVVDCSSTVVYVGSCITLLVDALCIDWSLSRYEGVNSLM